MDTKENLIKHALQALIRIAHLYARIETMPIPVDRDNTTFYLLPVGRYHKSYW